jgi:hypothetical protein
MNDETLDSTIVSRIVKARITELPKKLGDPLPEVWITLSDGMEKLLFRYYPDEISFTESELVGLTEEEARLLKFGRDRAYLQS